MNTVIVKRLPNPAGRWHGKTKTTYRHVKEVRIMVVQQEPGKRKKVIDIGHGSFISFTVRKDIVRP